MTGSINQETMGCCMITTHFCPNSSILLKKDKRLTTYTKKERDPMHTQKIGKRGTLFTFYELDNYPTNVFVISGNCYTILCDTFLGPASMEKIKQLTNKEFIVFNSHFHWDHIWGNCAFFSSLIVSHNACRELIAQEGESELQQYAEYAQGDVTIVYPNVTFTECILFPDEDVQFFYTPGHTKDSASCLDLTDNTLFVGDNVEAPIPYLFYEDLTAYIRTLQTYLDINPETIIPGHGLPCDTSLIRENLAYVEAFKANDTEQYETGIYQHIHHINKTQQPYHP